MKIKRSIWFTPRGACIGIVIVECDDGTEKAYIGVGHGKDQKADEQLIADYGSKLPLEAAKIL